MNVSRETVKAGVSRETQARLHDFCALVERWNSRINLVGSSALAELWSRHIRDSARLVSLLPPLVSSGVDLGSGAGFPGLVVALISGVTFHLIESDRRKAAFLTEAARVTDAPVIVHAARIESRPCKPALLITSRALAPLPRLLALAEPMLAPGGICLFLKGQNVETEIAAARKDWTMQVECLRDETNPSSVVLRVSDLARV